MSTVQDLGRPGWGPIGVSACGAADPIALRIGNALVGNPGGAAAIEMTMAGGTFLFPQGATIALAGALFESSHEFWRTHDVQAGTLVRTGRALTGARCYLCVRGGIEAPKVLGSASTHVVSGLGGWRGRALQAGDVLPIGPEPGTPPRRRVRRSVLDRIALPRILAITRGPQHDGICGDLAGGEYEVTAESNRTGIRLQGPRLDAPVGLMRTEGVSLGAVQVPPSGQPIILFVDAQTTGGYPVAANVIAAHLPALGQLRPGSRVRFRWVEVEEARSMYLEQEAFLRSEELLW